jgi:2-octaprenyl-6-methoxyphenol hydroxylase
MGERTSTDIFISGGGVAGLVAAAGFGAAGWRVVLADPVPPVTDAGDANADLRTTAFLQPSIPVLQAAGLWDRLSPHAAPLQVMRIIDAGGAEPVARITKDFDAAEISDQPFGWNLQNWLLRREMVARLGEMANVTFLPGVATRSVLPRQAEALVSLSDGRKLVARLVIGADGRDSPVRDAAGIGVKTMRYGQKALVFAVGHDAPHGNISTEVHRSGGPFTLVPLPDRADGGHQSAVVWMELGPEAERLAALPVAEFEAAILARSAGVLGPLTLLTRRSLWPIIAQLADRMSAQRMALIAEAAHVLPPIGAQGLNMSLADLSCLLDLTAGQPDPGAVAILDRYHRQRHWEVAARVTGIDALNRASMLGEPGLRDLRAAALNLAYGLKPVRQVLMKAGLGVR